MNRKKGIIGIIVLLIAVTLVFIVFKQKYTGIEGDYTGYQLILTAEYGGYGIAGQDLGSGIENKTYNISQNDILYEPSSGGLWALNVKIKENKNEKDIEYLFPEYSTILEIIKLEENTITIKNKDEIYNIEYNQEFNIPSNFTIYDGINYSYVIKITKEK